jgi:dTDP-4-dehydrorhamnose reductase
MTRVIVCGASGQLGFELQRARWPAGFEIVPMSRAQLDIADATAVASTIASAKPAVIVNAGAYTAVDRAEDEPEKAFAVNAAGTGHLARAAEACRARLLHISTDYVFDGTKHGWYEETDPIAPLGVYGRSKADGEQQALAFEGSTVLRTAWVYGVHGNNFVRTMLRLARERPTIGVVADQNGCPTAAKDIAAALVKVAQAALDGAMRAQLFHLTSPASASWHQFAGEVFKASRHGFAGEFRALSTDQYPARAKRPANSRLSSAAIETALGIRLPDWRESVVEVVRELEANSQ